MRTPRHIRSALKVKQVPLTLLLLLVFSLFFAAYGPAAQPAGYQQKSTLLVNGLVTVDGKPVHALIEIHSLHSEPGFLLNTVADKTTGGFKASLNSGEEYEIVVRPSQFPQQIISIHADTGMVMNVYADFVSPAYDKKIHELQQSILEKQKLDDRRFNLEAFAQKCGAFKKDHLHYKVQVGAFRFYENFNYSAVAGLPKIIRKTDDDQVTRFTMGQFETYSEAQSLLKKVQQHGLKEAFVVAFYKGDRKLLSQLVEEKIVP